MYPETQTLFNIGITFYLNFDHFISAYRNITFQHCNNRYKYSAYLAQLLVSIGVDDVHLFKRRNNSVEYMKLSGTDRFTRAEPACHYHRIIYLIFPHHVVYLGQSAGETVQRG